MNGLEGRNVADILIRGMEMPKSCDVCPFVGTNDDLMSDDYRYLYCGFQYMGQFVTDYEATRRADCPLVPLPEGRGRLIDADALFEKMYRLSDNEGAHKDSRVDDALILRDSACYLIEDAPTIVPAEGGTEDA